MAWFGEVVEGEGGGGGEGGFGEFLDLVGVVVDAALKDFAAGVGGVEEVSLDEEPFEGAGFGGGGLGGGGVLVGGGAGVVFSAAVVGDLFGGGGSGHFGVLVGEVEEAAGYFDGDGLVAIE